MSDEVQKKTRTITLLNAAIPINRRQMATLAAGPIDRYQITAKRDDGAIYIHEGGADSTDEMTGMWMMPDGLIDPCEYGPTKAQLFDETEVVTPEGSCVICGVEKIDVGKADALRALVTESDLEAAPIPAGIHA